MAMKLRQEQAVSDEAGQIPEDQTAYLMINLANAVYSVYTNTMNFYGQLGRDTALCPNVCQDFGDEDTTRCIISCILTRTTRFFGNVAEYGHAAADILRDASDRAAQSVDADVVTTGDGEYGYEFSYSNDPDDARNISPLRPQTREEAEGISDDVVEE